MKYRLELNDLIRQGAAESGMDAPIISDDAIEQLYEELSLLVEEKVDRSALIEAMRGHLSTEIDYAGLGATIFLDDRNGTENNAENMRVSELLIKRYPEERFTDTGERIANREQVLIDTLTKMQADIEGRSERTEQEELIVKSQNIFAALAGMLTMRNKIPIEYDKLVRYYMTEEGGGHSEEESKRIAKADMGPYIMGYRGYASILPAMLAEMPGVSLRTDDSLTAGDTASSRPPEHSRRGTFFGGSGSSDGGTEAGRQSAPRKKSSISRIMNIIGTIMSGLSFALMYLVKMSAAPFHPIIPTSPRNKKGG